MLPGFSPGPDRLVVHGGRDLVGQQRHDHVAARGRLGDRIDGETVQPGLRRVAIVYVADDHLHPAVAQVQRLRAALVAVAEYGDELVTQRIQCCVAFAKYPGHEAP